MFSSNSSQVSSAANYIEDVFSTYLYTGTGAALTITNNVNLSTYGGLVWIKDRSAARSHVLYDTNRGVNQSLATNSTSPTIDQSPDGVTAFNTTGFSLGSGGSVGDNTNGDTYVSWTFRKQPKFFDVVTYTGIGSSGSQTIPHNLGSVPGCIIVKLVTDYGNWWTWHRGLSDPTTGYLSLNSSGSEGSANLFNSTLPTSTSFQVGQGSSTNSFGQTYVAYLFAHNAGGFGLTGTDNVISCGSFTSDVTNGNNINLGYEAQFVIIKSATDASQWYMQDTMRGMVSGPTSGARLCPNLSIAEDTGFIVGPTAIGFNVKPSFFSNGSNIIYIAIRRGPMKVPTDATTVFAPATRTGTGTLAIVTSSISPVDMLFSTNRDRVASSVNSFWDRLRGGGVYLNSNSTDAEASNAAVSGFDVQNGVTMQGGLITNGNSYPYVNYNFRRAPGLFDEVCYTGTGSATTQTHNLGAVPELMIVKKRSGGSNWHVYATSLSASNTILLNYDSAAYTDTTVWNGTAPTTSVFSLGSSGNVNGSGQTFVNYLFATCPGVSKVGSYTGNATLTTINCGFTGGARFVLIKRTDASGAWYVWDTARGMVASTDPSLQLNSTAAESNANSVYSIATGFQLLASPAVDVNTSSATYIYLAIS